MDDDNTLREIALMALLALVFTYATKNNGDPLTQDSKSNLYSAEFLDEYARQRARMAEKLNAHAFGVQNHRDYTMPHTPGGIYAAKKGIVFLGTS